MTKFLHTAKWNGQTFKRTTEGRTFTHVVLARTSYEWALGVAKAGLGSAADRIAQVERKRAMGHYSRFEALGWYSSTERAEEARAMAERRGLYASVVAVEVTDRKSVS